jgi:ATP phosphoribosyltransferase
VALDVSITGSGEALPGLSGASAVADRVSTGETARQNGLVEIYKLCNLYSEIVVRREDA